MMARLTTMPAAPPTAWVTRPAINTSIVGATALTTDPSRKITSPTSSTGLRP
jgi:hypothetical protein